MRHAQGTSRIFSTRRLNTWGDGLDVGTPEEVRMDTQLILNASGNIREGKLGEIHSMLIYRDYRLVYEEYFPGHIYQWDGPNYLGDSRTSYGGGIHFWELGREIISF